MRYRIADLIVEMSPRDARLPGGVYRTSARGGAADITIRVGGAEALSLCPELETEDLAEYIATGDCFAVGLLSHEGMMLHARRWNTADRLCAFPRRRARGNPPTRKWVRLFGASILNDDKPALRRESGVWQVYGTPWSGKEALHQNRSAPCARSASSFRGGKRFTAAHSGGGFTSAAEPDPLPFASGGYGPAACRGRPSPAGDERVPTDLPE